MPEPSRKSAIANKAGGTSSGNNTARQSISQHRSTRKGTGREGRAKSTTYGGLQVQVNGKNMTPLPLLKRSPFDITANDNTAFIPESEPGSPQLPMQNQFLPKSSSKMLSPPSSPLPNEPGSSRPTSLRRQSSRNMLKPVAQEIKRSMSFQRKASKSEIQFNPSTPSHAGHGHGKHGKDTEMLPPGMTKEDLSKSTTFSLTESQTITLLHIASSCVATDDPKLMSIKAKNTQYAELCASKDGSDKYVARSAQTLNLAVKDKETATLVTSTKNASCLSIGFAIEDDYKAKQLEDEAIYAGETKEKETDCPRDFQKEVSVAVAVALATPGALLPVDNKEGVSAGKSQSAKGSPPLEPWSGRSNQSDNEELNVEEMAAQQLKDNVMRSKNLENALHTVERAVMQNMYHAKQLRYRGLPNATYVPSSDATPVHNGNRGNDYIPPPSPLSPNMGQEVSSPMSPHSPSLAWSEGGGPNGNSQAGEVANNEGAGSVSDLGEKSRLVPLFDFLCSETKGRTIHTMSFNKANSDVLAVAYGSKVNHSNRASTPHSAGGGGGSSIEGVHEKKEQIIKDEGGLVAFWSLRNPQYPERLIHTVTGVTALDFSSRIPNLLAVGLQDGTVAIYNMKRDGGDLGVPILDSSSLSTKHMEAVWQVKWVDKGPERGECLVSVSTDGRIAEWSMKKGLASSTLMVLRRSGNAEGSISRTAAGLSFDFPIGDPNTYFAGAEDGTLHRCSCSYTEQSLDATPGHAGPIYRVRCSPKHPSAILTCGADWSVKLWHKGSCVQTFHPGDLTDAVHDVCWSPLSSTVFASVAGDGRVEVWDLAQSKLDPSISMFCDGTVNEDTYEDYDDPDFKGEKLPAQTSVLFAPISKVLLVGDEYGRVKLYELQGVDLSSEFSDPQRLISAMQGNRA